MSKAFTKESDGDEDEHDQAAEEAAHAPLVGVKNYITPSGLQRLRDELRFLLVRERPAVTQVVAWAAGNGDRSENADYQYGKRRLREIDRRIRFLTKRIDAAEVVDPEAPRTGRAATHVFFGATVRTPMPLERSGWCVLLAWTRSIWIATTSAGCRHWRAR